MSAGAIIAILDVFFVLLLGIGFWQGWARGIKRSSVELATSFVCIIITGFITPPITNAILGITVTTAEGAMSLQTYFVNAISSIEGVSIWLESSPTMVSFLEKLPSVLLCAVVFLLVSILMRIIVYIIYKVISVIAFKSKKQEKELGLKRNRWAGAAISTFKMFMIALVMFMPLGSLVKLADDNLPTITAAAGAEDAVPKQVTDIVHGINKSAFGVLGGAVGLDDFMFDNISQFKINDKKIKVRKEVGTYLNLYTSIAELDPANMTISDVNWDDMDKLYEQATNTEFFDAIVLNIAGELMINYQTLISTPGAEQFQQYEQVFEGIKTGLTNATSYERYFKSDLDRIYYAFSDMGRSGYLDTLLTENVDPMHAITVLVQDYEPLIDGTINKIGDLNILHDAHSPLLDLLLQMVAGNEIGDIFQDANTQITDWPLFRSELKTIIMQLGNTNALIEPQVKFADIFTDPKNLLKIKNDTDKILEKLGNMLDTIDNMELFTTKQGDKLFDKILAHFNLGDILNLENGTKLNSYTQFFNKISPSVQNLTKLDLYNAIEGGMDLTKLLKCFSVKMVEDKNETGEYSSLLADTLLPLYELSLTNRLIFDELVKTTTGGTVLDFSLLETGEYNSSLANWQSDLNAITALITELELVKIQTPDGEQSGFEFIFNGGDINVLVDALGEEQSQKIIEPILNAISAQPLRDMLANEVVKATESATGKTDVTFSLARENFVGDDSQSKEISSIIAKALKLVKTQGGIENISFADLGAFIESLKLNAFRVELNKGTTQGITRSIFDAFIGAATDKFNIAQLFKDKQMYKIDFNKLFSLVDKLKEESPFTNALEEVILNGMQELENLKNVIENITAGEVENLATDIMTLANDLELKVQPKEEDKAAIKEIINKLSVGDKLKELLKNFFEVAK